MASLVPIMERASYLNPSGRGGGGKSLKRVVLVQEMFMYLPDSRNISPAKSSRH